MSEYDEELILLEEPTRRRRRRNPSRAKEAEIGLGFLVIAGLLLWIVITKISSGRYPWETPTVQRVLDKVRTQVRPAQVTDTHPMKSPKVVGEVIPVPRFPNYNGADGDITLIDV